MQSLETAHQLHNGMLVVDAHHDILMDVLARHKKGMRGLLSTVWAPRLKQGGVNLQILPIFVENRYLPGLGMREAFRMIEAALEDIEHDNSAMELATTTAEIHDIIANDKIAGVLAIEGCDGLDGDPAILRVMYRLGIRMVGFTWERRNAFADGTGVINPGGLTRVGRAALQEMMNSNIVFDVSHLAEPGFWDAIDIVDAPIVASHSNAKAICDHPRNLSDEQIKAIAETGGVIGLNFVGLFVDNEKPTRDRMADHLAHIVDIAGIEHVGLGPDFLELELREMAKIAIAETNFPPSVLDNWILDCQQSDQLPTFTATMLDRGFSQEEIGAVLGGNFMRVFEQIWR